MPARKAKKRQSKYRTFKITVNRADIIRDGHGEHNCPVHHAVSRKTKLDIGVGGDELEYVKDDYTATYALSLPKRVQNWISKYDSWGDGDERYANWTPKPISFTLRIPREWFK